MCMCMCCLCEHKQHIRIKYAYVCMRGHTHTIYVCVHIHTHKTYVRMCISKHIQKNLNLPGISNARTNEIIKHTTTHACTYTYVYAFIFSEKIIGMITNTHVVLYIGCLGVIKGSTLHTFILQHTPWGGCKPL